MTKQKYLIVALILIIILLLGGFVWFATKNNLFGGNYFGPAVEKMKGGGETSTGGTDGKTKEELLVEEGGSIILEILSPDNGSTASSANIIVKGKTVPGAEVFVDDKETKADAEGEFSVSLTLEEGENTIVVSVNDSEGNYTEKEIKVTL